MVTKYCFKNMMNCLYLLYCVGNIFNFFLCIKFLPTGIKFLRSDASDALTETSHSLRFGFSLSVVMFEFRFKITQTSRPF